MAIVDLDLDRVDSLNAEMDSICSALKNNYFPSLEANLNAIKDNVQGDELNEIITTIKKGYEDLCADFNEELPHLQEFLNEQIGAYDRTENQLVEELMDLLNVMTEHIYTVTYIGPAGILNVGNTSTPKEMVGVVEKYLRPDSVAEKIFYQSNNLVEKNHSSYMGAGTANKFDNTIN